MSVFRVLGLILSLALVSRATVILPVSLVDIYLILQINTAVGTI